MKGILVQYSYIIRFKPLCVSITRFPLSQRSLKESSGGVVVRALASHLCGPGSIFQTQCYMWVEFVGSLLWSERFSPGYSGFPLSSKTCIWLNLICINFNLQSPQLLCLNVKQTWHLNKLIVINYLVEQPRAVLFNPRVRKGWTTDSCRTSLTD